LGIADLSYGEPSAGRRCFSRASSVSPNVAPLDQNEEIGDPQHPQDLAFDRAAAHGVVNHLRASQRQLLASGEQIGSRQQPGRF
jgi:hypothetical protein